MTKLQRKKLELAFQTDVLKWLVDRKIWHLRYTASTTFGVPDVICIVNGIFVGVELKRQDGMGRTTQLQDLSIKAINDSGGVSGIVENLNDLEELIKIAEVKGIPRTDN